MIHEKSIVSIGQAAALIQEMPAKIIAAADELKIVPAIKINLVDHFDETDLQKIAEFLRKTQAAKSDR